MNIGYSYSLGNTFTTLLLLITKLLTIVLSVVIILGVITWIRDSFLKNKNTKFMQDINEDPILKAVVVITGAVIGVSLVFTVLSNLFNANLTVGGAYFNHLLTMTGIIMLLIKLLMFIFVASLVLAGIMYFKDQYEKGNLNFLTNNNQANNNKIKETENKKET